MNREAVLARTSRPGNSTSAVCVVCGTHRRPEFVPWDQHAIGCALRDAAVATISRESRLATIDSVPRAA